MLRMSHTSDEVRTLWVNARFMTRPVTGVERVAREVLTALVRDHLDTDGVWHSPAGRLRWVLIAPRTHEVLTNPWPTLPLVQAGRLTGHAWEQWDLPRLTVGQHLLNLCNTGPLLKHRQWMFLHDAQTFAIPQNFTWGLRLWYRTLFRTTGRLSAGVLTNSHFSAAELQRHAGIDKDRIRVAPLGADHMDRLLPELSPPLQTLMEHLAGRPFVLAVSSDNPNKNFTSVVQALDLLGEAAPPCVIVGWRNDQVFARSALDTSRVHHVGYVSDAELVALYQRAGVLAFPSHYEGFGLPALEAMWHGCPVVAARAAALPEVCASAALYCNPRDPSTLAQALQQVLHDEGLRQRMCKQGMAHARQFLWSTTARAVLDAMIPALKH